jgi:hypothetical protein
VLVGRAYAYGLGAAGQAGVARAIEILRADVVRTMKHPRMRVGTRPRSLVRGRAGVVAQKVARGSPTSSRPLRWRSVTASPYVILSD